MMRLPKYLLLLWVITIFSNCTKETQSVSEPVPAPSNINKEVMLSLVNNYRASGCNCGSTYFPPVAAVSWSNTLEQAAKDHSDDMYHNNFFEHTGSDGTTPGDRISKYSYRWRAYGENIAKGYPTEQQVMQGWMQSPHHCENIMNGDFREMGVAKTGDYWTQDFAARQ